MDVKPLSPEELERLESLLQTATTTPWEAEDKVRYGSAYCYRQVTGGPTFFWIAQAQAFTDGSATAETFNANAALIAEGISAPPALLASAREVETLRKALEQALKDALISSEGYIYIGPDFYSYDYQTPELAAYLKERAAAMSEDIRGGQ